MHTNGIEVLFTRYATNPIRYKGQVIARLTVYELHASSDGSDDAHDPIHEVAAAIRDGLIVYDNYVVYALPGNANDENLQENIRRAKSGRRGARQPVGWTVPFERALSAMSVDQIKEERVRNLARDPDKLTGLLGGLAFIRAQADMAVKRLRDIPDCIIPPETKTVQIWSPEGNTRTACVINKAISMGAEPVMTSANISGKPEAVTESDARRFAALSSPPLPIAVNRPDADKLQRPRGSYPVITLTEDGFKIVRPSCFDPLLLGALLHEYPTALASGSELHAPHYPHNVLRPQDLPKDVRRLRGSELRLGLLSIMGTL